MLPRILIDSAAPVAIPALPPTMALAPKIASVLIGNVHGAAFAAAVAGFFTEQLSEHFVERCAFGNAMAMAAVGAGDVIVLAQRFADADGDGFFANVEVGEPRHLGAEIELIDLFFEQPDLEHLAIEVQPALVLRRNRLPRLPFSLLFFCVP